MASHQSESRHLLGQSDEFNTMFWNLFGNRSAAYLFGGTLCGLIGGGYSTYITYAYTDGYKRHLNMEGEHFPSGHVYWPPSVSNMVSDTNSPPGKVWLCFMVTSAFMTMISQYPFYMRNVYTGDARFMPCLAPCLTRCCPKGIFTMMTARTYFPQIGMLMVALVHTAPANVWSPAQNSTIYFHTGGAVLWIGVTLYAEVYTLQYSKVAIIGACERKLRWACIVLCLACASLYVVNQVFSPEDLGLCCNVVYKNVTMETVEKARANGAFAVAQQQLALMEGAKFTEDPTPPLYQGMYDTASGGALVMILLGFWGEAGAGAFMLLNLLVIWYYAYTRRAVEMPDLEMEEPLVASDPVGRDPVAPSEVNQTCSPSGCLRWT